MERPRLDSWADEEMTYRMCIKVTLPVSIRSDC